MLALDAEAKYLTEKLVSKPASINDTNIDTVFLAEDMRIYALAYSFWKDPKYLDMVNQILAYLDRYASDGHGSYYVSTTDTHVYPVTNSWVAIALTFAYMVTENDTYLSKAQQTVSIIQSKYHLHHNGYLHELKNNSVIYLGDNAGMGLAYLMLYKATANRAYLQYAINIANFVEQHFRNVAHMSGYLSHAYLNGHTMATDATVSPTLNLVVMRFANFLYYCTEDSRYEQMAKNGLYYFMRPDVILSHSPGYTLLIMMRATESPLHVTIVGSKSDPIANSLFHTALSFPAVYTQIEWWDKAEGPLPNARIMYPTIDKSAAYICANAACSPPILSPQDLSAYIHLLLTRPSQGRNEIDSFTEPNNKKNPTFISPFSESAQLVRFLEQTNVVYVVFSFWVIGILLAFTPCYLPLILAILGMLGSGYTNITKKRLIVLAVTYALSLAITYAAAGLVAALIGISIQAYMQTAWVIVLFSLLFVVFAAIALGVFRIKLPDNVHQAIVKHTNFRSSSTIVGVFIIGALSTLIATPCMAAPLAAILTYVGSTGQIVFGILILFVTGLGMGTPLIFAAVLGKKYLPMTGPWQKKINLFFGLVLLAVAIIVARHILSTAWVASLWALLLVFTAINMGLLKPVTESVFAKLWKALSILILAYGLILLDQAVNNQSSIFNLLRANSTVMFSQINDLADLRIVFNKAKQEHKPVMLLFHADWCESCKQIDRDVLSDSKVNELLNHFIVREIDMNEPVSNISEIAKQYHVIAPPAILFFDENGLRLNVSVYSSIDVNDFKRMLHQIIEG